MNLPTSSYAIHLPGKNNDNCVGFLYYMVVIGIFDGTWRRSHHFVAEAATNRVAPTLYSSESSKRYHLYP